MTRHDQAPAPALCGCDYIRDENGRPLVRTGTAWRRWAAKLDTEAARRDGCTWAAVVAWIEHRNAYRIALAGQPER